MVNVNIPVESKFWEAFTIVVTDLDKWRMGFGIHSDDKSWLKGSTGSENSGRLRGNFWEVSVGRHDRG